MYHQYFGLNEAPFSIAVNPRYLFMSTRHRDALAHLLYGVGSGGGFILLTGEVGTGKTTINRCLLEQLPQHTDVAIILNPALNALELLASACDELGIEYDAQSPTLKTLTDKLHEFLLENHAKGRNTVLMIDEAQHLDFDVLEQIRLLTNLETNNQKLLQIILVGQPELAQLLSRPELRQLSQRITARYNLEPLNLEETRAYIRHRLNVAGLVGNREIFPDAVVRELFKRTRGIPRLINVLCDRILLGAYGQNKLQADRKMLQVAAREVMGEDLGSSASHLWARRGPLALVAIFFIGLGAAVAVGFLNNADHDAAGLQSVAEGGLTKSVQSVVAAPAKAIQTAPPAPLVEPMEEPGAPAWLMPPDTALLQLWNLYSAESSPEEICTAEVQWGLACVVDSAQTWQELTQFNRPMVLDMVTPERFSASVLLLGIRERSARILNGNSISLVPLAELGPDWRGTYRFLWRPPSGFTGPLFLGQRSKTVAEIARLFARLDGQEKSLTGDVFNAALKQRVVLFQRRYGLEDDGVVGMKTLLKLNELLGVDVSNEQAVSLLQSGFSAAGVL
jgi:general secretion pathway protein A